MVILFHHHQVLVVLVLVKFHLVELYYRMVNHHQVQIVKIILEIVQQIQNLLLKIFVHLNQYLLIHYQLFIQIYKEIYNKCFKWINNNINKMRIVRSFIFSFSIFTFFKNLAFSMLTRQTSAPPLGQRSPSNSKS